MKPAIIVHGGCFSIAQSLTVSYLEGTTSAARSGYDVLLKGGSAVDAVCAAVTYMENAPQFNAGTGSTLTGKGTVEMDAMVMNGRDLTTGAVCSVQRIRNPILLARAVMEKSDHCLLSAVGAEEFATSQNIPLLADPTCLVTEAARKEYELSKGVSFKDHVLSLHNTLYDSGPDASKMAQMASPGLDCHDTIGAVAIDTNGNIACSTSTGGIPGKLVGRVGDSPIVGCGGYASDAGGASGTGHGEAMMRTTTCRQAVFHMENGDDATEAARKSVSNTKKKTEGLCGVISIDAKGKVGYSFNGHRMAWASIDENGLRFGIDKDDVRTDLKEIC